MSWIPIQGKFDVKASYIKYIPSTTVSLPGVAQNLSGLVRSSKYFDSGEISFSLTINDILSSCNLVLNEGLPTAIYIGINNGTNAYAIRTWEGSMYKNLSIAGELNSLKLNEKINVSVKVIGSLIELYIEGVKVCASINNIVNSQIALWFYGPSNVEICDFKTKPIRPTVFVVMQFSKNYDELYDEVIKPTCEEFGFECIRADEMYSNGQIIEDILSTIKNSNLIIADITPDNPNVFYELGYAHGISKPTIIMCDRGREKLPFDISGIRTIFYENSISGKAKVEETLRQHLAIIKA